MNPMVLPLFRREGLEQRQIHLAEQAEGRDGFARIALVVVPGGHQGVLIHRLDGGSRRHENRLDPRAYDDLDIGKMGEDLCDRPLSGRGAPAQLRRGYARDQALEVRGSLRLDGERILVTDITQNALHVLLGGFLHWSDGRMGRWVVPLNRPSAPRGDRQSPVARPRRRAGRPLARSSRCRRGDRRGRDVAQGLRPTQTSCRRRASRRPSPVPPPPDRREGESPPPGRERALRSRPWTAGAVVPDGRTPRPGLAQGPDYG